VGLLLATALLAIAPGSHAQLGPIPKATGTLGTIDDISTALGMFRHVLASRRGVIAAMFTASGTMSEMAPNGDWHDYKVTKLTCEISYYPFSQGVEKSPGIRWDIERIGADGKAEHKIYAAADNVAWDEKEPGVEASPATGMLAERLLQIWLTPHGLIWAALNDDGTGLASGVTESRDNGKTVITVPVSGSPAHFTIDGDKRPDHVETRLKLPRMGETTLDISYSDYRDFEKSYYVYFPAHIVQRIGGRPVLDLTVSEFHTNPYVVFPVPENVEQHRGAE
jgi:hypothetical protein